MLNKTILTGYISTEPALTFTGDVPFCSFTMAVDRPYQVKNHTDLIPVVAWRQTAEYISANFKQGQLISLEGTLQSHSYVNKQCFTRHLLEVLAGRIYALGKNNQ